jgi:uncharacterized protein with PIN domain
MLKTNAKPCAKCGGKLRPVKSGDGMINALYCDECRTIHMLNDEYKSMEATIEQYNRKYTEQTGANDER